MILQCKNCNARYLVPDQAIGSTGRTVRCAKCSHSWFEAPSALISETPLPDFDKIIGDINATPKPLAAGSNLPVPKITTPISLKAMVAIFATIAIALGILIKMPELYGMSSSKGMVLADIKTKKKSDENTSTVEITGNIMNDSENPLKVPNLRVILLDGENNPLQSWEFVSNGETLDSKETLPFSTGDLNVKYSIAKRFVVDLGTPLEMTLRRKPQ